MHGGAPMLDFELSPELQELQIRARKVAAEGVADYGMHTDCWIVVYWEFSKRLAEEGWIGMTWPVEYSGGGQSNGPHHHGRGHDLGGAPIAASYSPTDRWVRHCSTAPRTSRRNSPGMLSGETTWCIGMSEPDATPTCRPQDVCGWRRCFVVNGQKIWTSFAADADYCYLICRTSSDRLPHKGDHRS